MSGGGVREPLDGAATGLRYMWGMMMVWERIGVLGPERCFGGFGLSPAPFGGSGNPGQSKTCSVFQSIDPENRMANIPAKYFFGSRGGGRAGQHQPTQSFWGGGFGRNLNPPGRSREKICFRAESAPCVHPRAPLPVAACPDAVVEGAVNAVLLSGENPGQSINQPTCVTHKLKNLELSVSLSVTRSDGQKI